jgi:hypothetical protein
VWILLHHFDAVLDGTELDPQFGIAFFDQLNALKKSPALFFVVCDWNVLSEISSLC